MTQSHWTCKNCKTTDTQLKYNSSSMQFCKDCQKYKNIQINSNVARKRVRKPELLISEHDFLNWIRSSERKCFYCDISENQLSQLEIKSQIGLKVQSLGIDRIDSSGDYTTTNIVLCCFMCNKVKSDCFTISEMKFLGESIKQIWKKRLEVLNATNN